MTRSVYITHCGCCVGGPQYLTTLQSAWFYNLSCSYIIIYHIDISAEHSCGSCVCRESLDTTAASRCQPARRACRWWHADRDRLTEHKNCWKILKNRQTCSLCTGSATIIGRLVTEHKQLNMSETHSVSHMGLLWSWHDRQVLHMEVKHWLQNTIAVLLANFFTWGFAFRQH